MKTHRKPKLKRIVEGFPAAEAATGIPVDVLKRMKALGCDAFEPGSRIDRQKAKDWFAIPENAARVEIKGDNLSLKDQKLNEEVRKLRRNNDREDAKLILITTHHAELQAMADAVTGVVMGMADLHAVSLAGQPVVEVHARLTAIAREVIGKLSRGETK